MIRLRLAITAEISSLAELEGVLDLARGLFPAPFLRRLQVGQEARGQETVEERRRCSFTGSIRKVER